MMAGWKTAAALLGGCASLHDALTLPYVSTFSDSPPGKTLPGGWEPWTLSRLKKPTQYSLVDEAGRTVVKASAHASASGLIHPLKLNPKTYPLLSWRWKVASLIPSADNTRRQSEDSPVRVVVAFGGNIDKLPLDDRLFFDNIRLVSGQQMPRQYRRERPRLLRGHRVPPHRPAVPAARHRLVWGPGTGDSRLVTGNWSGWLSAGTI